MGIKITKRITLVYACIWNCCWRIASCCRLVRVLARPGCWISQPNQQGRRQSWASWPRCAHCLTAWGRRGTSMGRQTRSPRGDRQAASEQRNRQEAEAVTFFLPFLLWQRAGLGSNNCWFVWACKIGPPCRSSLEIVVRLSFFYFKFNHLSLKNLYKHYQI